MKHRDNKGDEGSSVRRRAGWMTGGQRAFRSIEMLAQSEGLMRGQLAVNLPAAAKMTPPRYQELLNANIPAAPLPGGAGSVRVIAGEFHGTKGPAQTVTPVHLWDLRLTAGHSTSLPAPDGYNTGLLVRRGRVSVGDGQSVGPGEFVLFDRAGEGISLECEQDALALVVSGQPIGQSVVGHGPFVMNTPDEIEQAFRDYQAGRF